MTRKNVKIPMDQNASPTLEEFLTFVTDSKLNDPTVSDEHWMPISNLCNPCDIHYDYIGNTDEMAMEFRYILEKALGDNYPEHMGIHYNLTQFGKMSSQMASVNSKILTKVRTIFHHDFAMFSRQGV